jgi:hypothetical protein
MRLRAAVLLSILAAAVLVAAPTASASPFSFGPPVFVDDTFAGGEPLLFTDTMHNTIVYSSHEGTTHLYRAGLVGAGAAGWITTYRNQVKIWTSSDQGKTWQRANFQGTGFTQNPSQNSGFSDPDLSQDEGGRIYNTGINLATNSLFSSGDGGKTWDKGTAQCETGDRPWVMGGKPEEVFWVTNRIGPNEVLEQIMLRSVDGGNTCGGEGGPAIKNYGTWSEKDGGGSFAGNGKPYYDHVNNTVVAPITDGGHTKLGVSIYKRGGDKFVPHLAVEAPSYAHWPSIALDGAGTIYLTYDVITRQEGNSAGCDGAALPNPSDIYYVYSKDQGETWSAPIRIGVTPNVRSFWPWAVAGDKGKLNLTWYQTDKVVDLGCQEADITPWATTITNADDAAKAKIETPVSVTGRPIANSNVCETGTTCVATGVDRRLGDFFSNWIDANGCVIIGTGDTTQPDPITGADRPVSLPLFVKQKSGPKLIGSGDCDGSAGAVPAPDGKPVAVPKPVKQSLGLPSTKRCLSKRAFDIRLRAPKGQRIASATVTVAGKKVKVRKKGGRFVARVNLKGLKKSKFKVAVNVITAQGRSAKDNRTYRTCAKRKK